MSRHGRNGRFQTDVSQICMLFECKYSHESKTETCTLPITFIKTQEHNKATLFFTTLQKGTENFVHLKMSSKEDVCVCVGGVQAYRTGPSVAMACWATLADLKVVSPQCICRQGLLSSETLDKADLFAGKLYLRSFGSVYACVRREAGGGVGLHTSCCTFSQVQPTPLLEHQPDI